MVSSLLFFGSVLFDELSHTFVALRYNMRTPSITLFVFGGVSQVADEMRNPKQEFLIAVAGPLSHVGAGGDVRVFGADQLCARDVQPAAGVPVGWGRCSVRWCGGVCMT